MYRNDDPVIKVLATVVFLVVSIVVGTYVLRTIHEQTREANTITTQTIRLASLDYVTEIEGEIHGFGLGLIGHVNGSISESSCYVAYRVHENGGKSLYKIPTNIAILYDTLDKNQDAYAEVDVDGYGTTKQIRLYVPQGTVPQNYDVSID